MNRSGLGTPSDTALLCAQPLPGGERWVMTPERFLAAGAARCRGAWCMHARSRCPAASAG